ncbi:MAG: endonuclease [Ignavibacteria bacterium]
MHKRIKVIIIAVILIFSSKVFPQPLINFDTTLTNNTVAKNFYVKNPTNKLMQIYVIRTLTGKFFFNIPPFTINPFDSVQVTVYFRTNQNVTYRDFLIFENNVLNKSIVYYVLATAKYPDTLYRFTQGLYDEQLKTAIRNFTTQGYVSLGYNTARDKMFEFIDDYNNDDTIECVYIGRKIKAANRTQAQNQGFNTEHTYPQSFFNSNEPMLSDLFHLFPTDNYPNTIRSNYPFGIVVSNITWDSAGSKLGKDYEGSIVFEPRNVHKGNVARALFYFVVKYTNLGGFMSGKQETALRQWNIQDTVDWKERLRNERIATFQKVRNPFIDHPELVDRIRSTFSTIPDVPRPKISASPFLITFDTLAVNDTTSYYLSIMNYGKGNLNITSVNSNSQQFIVETFPNVVTEGTLGLVKIKFKPTAINQTYTGTITVNNSDSTINIVVKGFSNSVINVHKIADKVPVQFTLHQNYPNPFNSTTKIVFDVPYTSRIKINLYDVAGKMIVDLVDGTYEVGSYDFLFDASFLSTGVYFLRMTSGNFTATKRIFYLR